MAGPCHGLRLGFLAHVRALDEMIEELGEVLNVAKVGQGGQIAGEGARMVLVHPERGGVEALPDGLAGAAHAAEVANELQRGGGVVVLGGGEELA